MCLSQPEFSRPHRKSVIDGARISPTAWRRERGRFTHTQMRENKKRYNHRKFVYVLLAALSDNLLIFPHHHATVPLYIIYSTHTLLTVDDFLLAAPHHMNVFDANELQLDVGVVVFVLISFTCCSICHGVQLDTHTHTHIVPYIRILQLIVYLYFSLWLFVCVSKYVLPWAWYPPHRCSHYQGWTSSQPAASSHPPDSVH